MSKGYGAIGKLLTYDNNIVEYIYCSYNANVPKCEEQIKNLDGKIIIDFNVFKTIDCYRRYKGNATDIEKKTLKVSIEELDYESLHEKGMVHITNSSAAWLINENGIDRHAISLLSHIIYEYKRTEKMPKSVEIFY